IALAMHDYHDAHNTLPPRVVGTGLSWRVALLPYLDQKALYDRFHHNEPWNSPHNMNLIPQIPAVYAGTGLAEQGHTYWQVFESPEGAFGRRPLGLGQFPDGTARTFLVVEAATPVPWTKPDDIPMAVSPRLGAQFPGVFLAAFGDGAVYELRRN